MRSYDDQDLEMLREVLQDGRLCGRRDGMVTTLGAQFAERVGARYGVARNSNLTALSQLLAMFGVGPGDEVICDPLVHFGAVAALSVGAVPVFADVNERSFNIDPGSVSASISAKTKAVIATHLWGQSFDAAAIAELCRQKGLWLIEDCAHAIGTRWDGKHAGTWGDAGVFSFQQNKQLSTGHGGLITTDHEWIKRLLLNEWGSGESPTFLTLNYHMTELAAAVGVVQLGRVDQYLAAYSEALRIIEEHLGDAEWLVPRWSDERSDDSPYWWSALAVPGFPVAEFGLEIEELWMIAGSQFTKRPAATYHLFRAAGVDQRRLLRAEGILEQVVHISVIEMSDSEAERVGKAARAIGDQLWKSAGGTA